MNPTTTETVAAVLFVLAILHLSGAKDCVARASLPQA